jgi:hypothetical protein
VLTTEAVPFVEIDRFVTDIPMYIRASNQLLSHDPQSKQLGFSRHDPRNGTCRWLVEQHDGFHHMRCVNERDDRAMYIGAPGTKGELHLHVGPGRHTRWKLIRTGRGNMYKMIYHGDQITPHKLQLIVHAQGKDTRWLQPYSSIVKLINSPSMHESWLKHLSDPKRVPADHTIFCTDQSLSNSPELLQSIHAHEQLPSIGSLSHEPTRQCNWDMQTPHAVDAVGAELSNMWRTHYDQVRYMISNVQVSDVNQLRQLLQSGEIDQHVPLYNASHTSVLQSFMNMCEVYPTVHHNPFDVLTGDCFVVDKRSMNLHEVSRYSHMLTEIERANQWGPSGPARRTPGLGYKLMQHVWLFLFDSNNFQGPVAQRLEQRTHNPLVVGSNPTGPTKFASQITRGLSKLTQRTHVLQQIDPLLEQAFANKSFSKSSLARSLKPLTKLFEPD